MSLAGSLAGFLFSPWPFARGLSCALLVLATSDARALHAQSAAPADGGQEAGTPAAALVELVLEGFVLGPDGAPVEGAAVASSAGGAAVTDRAGHYRLVVDVPRDVRWVDVAAVVRTGAVATASARVAIGGRAATVRVDPLQLVADGSCSPT